MYFDLWAMLVGVGLLAAGTSFIAGFRGRLLFGLLGVVLILADRSYAIVFLSGPNTVFLGIQIVATVLVGYVIATMD